MKYSIIIIKPIKKWSISCICLADFMQSYKCADLGNLYFLHLKSFYIKRLFKKSSFRLLLR